MRPTADLVHWGAGRRSGHGTHDDYDKHVPVIFLCPELVRATGGSLLRELR